MMKKRLSVLLLLVGLLACATRPVEELDFEDEIHSGASTAGNSKKMAKTKSGTVVTQISNADIKVLEAMNRALDDFALRKNPTEFNRLCRGSQFDCYVNESYSPKGKKRRQRLSPPYATGQKLGKDNDKALLIRYEYYP